MVYCQNSFGTVSESEGRSPARSRSTTEAQFEGVREVHRGPRAETLRIAIAPPGGANTVYGI